MLLIPAKAGIQSEPMNKQPAVYILASKRNGTLYIGVTSNLAKRVWETRTILSKDSPNATVFITWSGMSLTITWSLPFSGKNN